jgi:AcrR family transcriptional regulator
MNKRGPEDSPAAEHAEAQRHRILDAARECFIDYGFHAASMSRIAETAGISQGLAYRYFENKSAMIRAMIERQLEERKFSHGDFRSSEELIRHVLDWLESPLKQQPNAIHPVLFLEMNAESSRDTDIRKALKRGDRLYREDFGQRIARIARSAGREITREEIDERFFALQCLIEGLFVRAVREGVRSHKPLNRYLAGFIADLLTL